MINTRPQINDVWLIPSTYGGGAWTVKIIRIYLHSVVGAKGVYRRSGENTYSPSRPNFSLSQVLSEGKLIYRGPKRQHYLGDFKL